MKKILFLLVAVLSISFASGNLFAGGSAYGPKNKRFGAGIVAGEPTGITFKGYPTSYLAIDAIAAWSFVDDAFTAIGDITYDFFDIPVSSSVITLPFYAGAGAKVAVRSKDNNVRKTRVGVRVPVGVAAQWVSYPVEVFLEVGPGVQLVPETEFDISGGIGVRYYF